MVELTQERKKVAVFVSGIYGAINYEMQHGIKVAALKEGVKVIFFAAFSDGFSREFYDQYEKYDEGDIVSFKIPDLRDFDGAIYVADSLPVDYKARVDKIIMDSGIPVINLGGYNENYYSILNDESKSFSAIVDHIIEEHGCKDIYHIAGRKELYFTHERIDATRDSMERHGLTLPDEKIYYGTLWRDCGEPALEYVLEKCAADHAANDSDYDPNKTYYPDAIVCANDYTAIGIVNACRARGIQIPEDLIVTGYDGIEVANLGSPSITTYQQPFYEVGIESIHTLQRLWNGEEVDKIIRTSGKINLNQSCGCVSKYIDNRNEIRSVYAGRMDKMEYLSQSMTNMILSMSNADSLEECVMQVERNAHNDTGFTDFLLCLAPDWDKHRVVNDESVLYDETMTVVCGFRGDKPVENQTFELRELMPKDMMDDPNPYYIFSIHHLQYYMGYLIVTPQLEGFNQLIMKSWLVNLGSMLENWRVRNDFNNAIDRLENMYNRDMLTGLYNRRGYEKFFEEIYSACTSGAGDTDSSVGNDIAASENESAGQDTFRKIGVLVIDMDDLKYVNDTFGHSEGDYSITSIAEAMIIASQDGEICFRTGGDEFVVLVGDYSEEKADAFINRLRSYINTKVKLDEKEFPLQVSIGACIAVPVLEEGMTLIELSEQYMKLADEEMYKEKKIHKEFSGNRRR